MQDGRQSEPRDSRADPPSAAADIAGSATLFDDWADCHPRVFGPPIWQALPAHGLVSRRVKTRCLIGVMRRAPARLLLVIVGTAAAAAALGFQAGTQGGPDGPDARDRRVKQAAAEVEAGRRTTPVIGEPGPTGEVMVTFLAEGEAGRPPRIVSDVTGWGEHIDGTFDFTAGTMARVGETAWYFLQARVAARARIEYRIAYGQADYRFDPHNPRRSAGPQSGGAEASEFVTPGYVPPQEFEDPRPSSAGSLSEAAIQGPCRTIVYTPAGYSRASELPVAVFLDLRTEPISRVLDWLIARGEMRPVIAAFVGVRSDGDNRCSGEVLRRFVAAVAPGMAVGKGRGVAARGASRGDRHLLRREGRARDGPRPPGGVRTRRAADPWPQDRTGRPRGDRETPRRPASRGDPGRPATTTPTCPPRRALRAALAAAGHGVEYVEVPEGHSAVTWRNHLRAVLVDLFGPPGDAHGLNTLQSPP